VTTIIVDAEDSRPTQVLEVASIEVARRLVEVPGAEDASHGTTIKGMEWICYEFTNEEGHVYRKVTIFEVPRT
jgi:hypothetical protein